MARKTLPLTDFNARFGSNGEALPIFLPTTFRKHMRQDQAASTAEIDALFTGDAGLLHSQTVASYLQSFCTSPGDMKNVLADLKEIWLQEGLLPIDDLTLHLTRRRLRDVPEMAANILHRQIEANYREVEPLTRYDRKEHAPLTVGLGHLYAVLTNRPVTLIMADDSNLGGLTQHIDKLLAARDGRAPGQTEEGSEAFEIADRILRAMAGVARDALQEGIAQTRRMASSSANRNGGDEKIFLINGVPYFDVEKIADQRMKPAVEDLTAALGLHEHEPGKARDNRFLAGTSTGFISVVLGINTRPGIDITEADAALSDRKLQAGAERRGRVPFELFNQLSSDDALTAGPIQPDVDPNLAILDAADRMVRSASRQRQHFDELARKNDTAYEREANALDYDLPTYDAASDTYGSTNQRHLAPYNMSAETAGRLLQRIDDILNSDPYAKYQQPLPKPEEVERSSDRPNLLFATPIELDALRFDHQVQKTGMYLQLDATDTCHRLLASFSPIDPSTGGLMKDVMPGMFGRFARDTDRLRECLRSTPDFAAEIGIKAEKVECIGMAAALTNLAGLNKLLGSKNADIALRYFTEEIVAGSYKASGMNRDSLEIGHEGGGNLMILPRPVFETGNGLRLFNSALAKEVSVTMEKRMSKWRNVKVATFLREHGGTVPEVLSEKLTFGQIVDPKRSRPGINIVTAAMKLQQRTRSGLMLTGGQLRKQLADLRDARINASRSGNAANRLERTSPPSL